MAENPGQDVEEAKDVDDAEMQAYIASFLKPITREEQHRIASLVQHLPSGEANPEWLASRVGRATGSAVGAIYGVNKYTSPGKKLEEIVWNTFKGNHMTRYGNDNEDNAEDCFREWMEMRLHDCDVDDYGFELTDILLVNRGLCVCRQEPIFAMSPDGFLVESWTKEHAFDTEEAAEAAAAEAAAEDQLVRDDYLRFSSKITQKKEGGKFLLAMKKARITLVEYKCPYKGKSKGWYDEFDVYPVEKIKKANGVELPMPSYYYAQVQHGMNVLGVRDDMLTRPEKCYFVVWHPAYYTGETALDFWTTQNPSKTSLVVAGRSGTIFITEVPYDHDYAERMSVAVRTFVLDRLLPTLFLKEKGLLDNGQMDEVTLINMDEDPAEKKKKKRKAAFAVARQKEEDAEDHKSVFESMGFVFAK